MQALWKILYDAGAELVVSGHEHHYERFKQMNASGSSTSSGLRQFVVGTGGSNEYAVAGPGGTLEASATDVSGVLALTLHPDGYDWRFVPVAGGTYTDAGSGSCH